MPRFQTFQSAIVPLMTLSVISLLGSHCACASDFDWSPTAISENWNSPFNWGGPAGQFPDGDNDMARVEGINTDNPQLTSDRVIGQLTIRNGGQVANGDVTDSFRFQVLNSGVHSGETLVDGALSLLTNHDSGNSSDFETNSRAINDFGTVFLRASRLRVSGNVDITWMAWSTVKIS